VWCACLLKMTLAVGSSFGIIGDPVFTCHGTVRVLRQVDVVEVHRTIGGIRAVAILNIPHFPYDDQVIVRFCWGQWDATIAGRKFPVLYTKGDALV